ncbi:MAG: hypothetical protein IJU63_08660 [Bacteroidales bacterium]|nr:hypothetical protein [Bacteroidales bacterium]
MICIYTLTSPLHDEQAVRGVTEAFLGGLGVPYCMKGADFSDFGADGPAFIFVRTGGTESLFVRLLPSLPADAPLYLLASGKSNSLPAAMEILSYLNARGRSGEILHGSSAHIAARMREIERVDAARRKLRGMRLGVIGKPSDWLIASQADPEAIRKKLGMELVDIPMEELLASMKPLPAGADAEAGALRIYDALKELVARYALGGLTLRCFDLLGTVHNTGCLALARLNEEGIVASCEGDVPALLSMCLSRALTGVSGFQANPSRIDPERGEVIFAHCTVPLDMVDSYCFDTHYESGIGIGIRGKLPAGDVTVFKLSGDLKRCFAAEGVILRNLEEKDLCRTQVLLRLPDTGYFLSDPIGNHHIVVPGHCADLLKKIVF